MRVCASAAADANVGGGMRGRGTNTADAERPGGEDMEVLERNWWAIALRGVVAIMFGAGAVFRPIGSLLVMAALFGAWWFADGALTIVAAVYAAEHHERWVSLFAEGLVGILLGVAVYFLTLRTTLALVLVLSLWAAATGAMRIVTAARLRGMLPNDRLMVTSGAVAVLFAAVVWAFLTTPARTLVMAVGVFALVLGALFVALSVKLYGFRRGHRAHAA